MSAEQLQVYFEHGPVLVDNVTPPASIVLENGIRLEERFFGHPGESANFRVTGAKDVAAADEVDAAYEAIVAVLGLLRILWPIAGGMKVEAPLVSNHEEVYRHLLSREGKDVVSHSTRIPIESVGRYSKMPLAGAISALRRLGRLSRTTGSASADSTIDDVRWLCVEWFEMASAATQPLDKFTKAFPPIDLLASKHQEGVDRHPSVEAILSELRRVINEKADLLGERRRKVLLSNLKDVALQDKFLAFVTKRFPEEAELLATAFAGLNKTRNAVFHNADYRAVSQGRAEEAAPLLLKCLRAELEIDL